MKILQAILLCLITTPVLASYTDGFFGIIISAYAFPVMIVGLLISVALVKFDTENDSSFMRSYIWIWRVISILSCMVFSLWSVGGGDYFSALIICIVFTMYTFIVTVPVSSRLNDIDLF